MRKPMIETLESRRLMSTTTIALAGGNFKGSSVSDQGFTTRLTMTLGKEHTGGTIIGTFDYLNGFKFEMHLRVGADNTFHGTITTGKLAGTLTSGRITTASHATIIDLSGHYAFSNGSTDSDAGTFLVRN